MNAQLDFSLHRARLEAAEQAKRNRIERELSRPTEFFVRRPRSPLDFVVPVGLVGWAAFCTFVCLIWSVL